MTERSADVRRTGPPWQPATAPGDGPGEGERPGDGPPPTGPPDPSDLASPPGPSGPTDPSALTDPSGPTGPQGFGGAGRAPADAPPWRSGGWFGAHRALTAGLICAVAMALVGFPLGLLWAATAPHLDVAAGLGGHESAFAVQSDIDARFGLICAVAGLVGGAVAFWRVRDAGWPVPLGLAVGGTGGSLIAGWIGHLRRSPELLHALPKDSTPLLADLVDLKVRAHGLYLVMPATALIVLVIALWATTARVRPGVVEAD